MGLTLSNLKFRHMYSISTASSSSLSNMFIQINISQVYLLFQVRYIFFPLTISILSPASKKVKWTEDYLLILSYLTFNSTYSNLFFFFGQGRRLTPPSAPKAEILTKLFPATKTSIPFVCKPKRQVLNYYL